MILSAQSIRDRCGRYEINIERWIPHDRPMITPFSERAVGGGLSYGLSAAGYDVRLAEGLQLYRRGVVYLASTVERFNMPLNVLGHVCDKSTWARRGLFVQNTIIEPGWRGYLTLELTAHDVFGQENMSLSLKAGIPIAQVVFHLLDEPSERPYAGKYQDQPPGPQPAREER